MTHLVKGIKNSTFNEVIFISVQVRERDVESYLVSSCNRNNLPCLKFSSVYKTGMPDRIILLPDQRCVWVETKTDTGELSEIQKLQHHKLRQAGHIVYVPWTKKDVDRLMHDLVPEEEEVS